MAKWMSHSKMTKNFTHLLPDRRQTEKLCDTPEYNIFPHTCLQTRMILYKGFHSHTHLHIIEVELFTIGDKSNLYFWLFSTYFSDKDKIPT